MTNIRLLPRKKREFTLSDDSHDYINTLPSRTASVVVDEALKLHKQKSLNKDEPKKPIIENIVTSARIRN